MDQNRYNQGIEYLDNVLSGGNFSNAVVFGDYVNSKIPNTAVRAVQIPIMVDNLEGCKATFLNILRSRLKKGPVSMLLYRHYVTIYGMKGDHLLVKDSDARTDTDAIHVYGESISDIFNNGFEHDHAQIELVYLEDIKGNEAELTKEFPLIYKNGEFSKDSDFEEDKGIENIIQYNGIEVSKFDDNNFVSSTLYVPKKISG